MIAISEGVLVSTAKAGWVGFSKLIDVVSRRRKTKQYEAEKKRAFQQILSGDACDWDYVSSVLEKGLTKGDQSADIMKLRRLHVAHAPRTAAKKRASTKKAAKRKAGTKRKCSTKKTAKIRGRKVTSKRR